LLEIVRHDLENDVWLPKAEKYLETPVQL